MLILGSNVMRKRGSLFSETLYSSGYNIGVEYVLGVNDQINRSSPVVVTAIPSTGVNKSWKTLSSGYGHNAVINSLGHLYIWGSNSYGQWGDASTSNAGSGGGSNRSSPIAISASNSSSKSWTVISAGGASYTDGGTNLQTLYEREYREVFNYAASGVLDTFYAGITTDGKLWVWGSNSDGRLGLNTTTTTTVYSPVQVGTNTNWVDVACGIGHAVACNSAGEFYVWGKNDSYQLGLLDTISRSSPTLVTNGFQGVFISKVYATGNKTFVLSSDGFLQSAGSVARTGVTPSNGQFGYYPRQVTTTSSGYNNSFQYAHTTSNQVFGGTASLAATTQHALMIMTNGDMYAAGINDYGQLGMNHTSNRSSFTLVSSGEWSKASVALLHSAAIKTNGNLYTWGYNNVGQLGTGDTLSRSSPTLIATGVADVAAIHDNTYYIKTDGTLWVTGIAENGSLADQDITENASLPAYGNRSTPLQIGSGLTGLSWDGKYVGSGSKRYIAPNKTGYVWGYMFQGVDPSGGNNSRGYYRKVPGSWTAVATGSYHTLAIKTNGTLWAWGYNANGQLGLGNTIDRSLPVQIGSGTDWKAVTAGANISAALNGTTSSYTLFVWGLGTYGSLGHSLTTSRSAPISLGTASWKSVAAGGYTMMGITNNDYLYSWGMNADGQLGLNSTLNRSSPTLVGTQYANAKLAVGASHVHIIKSDGSLWSSGAGSYGRLGTGSLSSTSSFTQVGSSSWTFVTAGVTHSAGVDFAGRLQTWGRNNTGQLAGPSPLTDTYKLSPVVIGAKTSWTAVAATSFTGNEGWTIGILRSEI